LIINALNKYTINLLIINNLFFTYPLKLVKNKFVAEIVKYLPSS